MTQKVFLRKMQEEILDTEEEITLETELINLEEWDSLAIVSFTAMAKMQANCVVDRTAVHEAVTVGDLFALLK